MRPSSIAYNEGVNLVVFVKGRAVVGWFEHSRGRGDLADVDNVAGYARDEAHFVVVRHADEWLAVVAR
jgi:hypothetical protein